MHHKFKVRDVTHSISISEANIVGVLALLGLDPSHGVNPRVVAVKFLRKQMGLGLLEAGFIIALVAEEKWHLNAFGDVVTPVVDTFKAQYLGKEE